MRERGRKPEALKRVAIGGSACPRAMISAFEKEFSVEVGHAWGMTETSPIGTCGFELRKGAHGLDQEGIFDLKAKQGSAPFGVELIITDDDDNPLPWDGKTVGRLKVRGPVHHQELLQGRQARPRRAGLFRHRRHRLDRPRRTLCITDRSKDVIKSGGEWISSVQIENIATAHPDVHEAAVIGMKHPKWDERPLLVIVPAKGKSPGREEVLGFLDGKIAKWWMPDDVQLIEEIPHTAAGKINKLGLREKFADYKLPSA